MANGWTSERRGSNPTYSDDRVVMKWLEAIPDEALHISVLTLGEIRRGIERLNDGGRRERLRTWLEHELPGWFGERMLAVDLPVADRWGRLRGLPSIACWRRPRCTMNFAW